MADKLLDKVKEYAAELEAAGRSPGYAYATAWARACKYHPELDDEGHCTRGSREYLTRKTNRRILGHLHRRCKGLPHGGELMYWAAMARGVRTRAVSLHGHVVLVYQREAFAPDLDDAAAVDEVLRRGTPLDAAHPPAYLEAQLEQLAAPERNPRKPEQVAWVGQYAQHHFDHPKATEGEVRTHFNLHTGGYTIDQRVPGTGWRKRDDKTLAVLLLGASFEYQPSGHRRYSEGPEAGRRNVHAWVYGTESHEPVDLSAGWRPCRYSKNPPCFVDIETRQCLPNDRSIDVYLSSRSNIDPDTGKPRKSMYERGRAVPWAPVAHWRPAARRNPAPLIFYHGAQRWEGPPQIVAHRKGHAEHGPGIYLTTSWTTASKYAKGGGSVYRVEVSPLVRWLEDADLPLQETVDWVKALPRLRGKSDIMASLQRIASRVGKLPAEVLVNNFVNADAASGEHGPALADYLVRHGVDASHVRHGAEDWVVIFNPQTVLSVDRIASKDMDKGFSFDLPRVQRNPARRRRPRAPSTEGL